MIGSLAGLPFFFDERHRALDEGVRRAASALGGQHDPGHVAWAMGGQHHLYQHLLPESGSPDVRTLCLIREALAYHSPLADAIFAVQGLGTYPLLLEGTAEQRHRLADARAGDVIGAFALTEPGAGSDVSAIATQAAPTGGGWSLTGEKTFISNAGIAHHYVLFATVDPSAGRDGITAFLVPADAPGLHVALLPMSGDHPLGRLVLDDCRLPQDAVIGERGGGFSLAMRTLDTFRVTVGAAAVGMAQRALDEAVKHVRKRVQFGKPLAAQQLVQGMVADMATELEAARLMVYRAAHGRDTATGRQTRAVSMAKLYATEAAQRVVDQAVQLLGGRAVTSGNIVEQLYREVRPLRIYEGTSEIQRLIIARDLLRSDP